MKTTVFANSFLNYSIGKRRIRGWWPIVLCGLLLLPLSCGAGGIPDTIDGVRPSIVAVGSWSPLRAPRGQFFGTGFAVGDGLLVATNAHVVDREPNFAENEKLMVFVRAAGGEQGRPAEIVARDPHHDLALLRIGGPPLPALRLASARRAVREGQTVLFTGYPIGTVLGLHPVTHRGMISAIVPIAIPAVSGRELTPERIRSLRDPFEVYQLDGTAYPGSSGSPVYDPRSGEVLGIINMVFVKKRRENALRDPSGIAYAIPVRYLRDLMSRYGK